MCSFRSSDFGQAVLTVEFEIVIIVVPRQDVNPPGIDVSRKVPDRVFPADPRLVRQITTDDDRFDPRPLRLLIFMSE
jgi:hypothetical protein